MDTEKWDLVWERLAEGSLCDEMGSAEYKWVLRQWQDWGVVLAMADFILSRVGTAARAAKAKAARGTQKNKSTSQTILPKPSPESPAGADHVQEDKGGSQL